MKTTKIQYFEGLRGVAALMVFFFHFNCTFSWLARPEISNQSFLVRIIDSIYFEFTNFLFSGEVPVFLFWLLSAHLISKGYFELRDEQNKHNFLLKATVKRYFRFVIPVFVSSLLAYVLFHFNLFYQNIQVKGLEPLLYQKNLLANPMDGNLLNFIKISLIDVYLNSNNMYNTVLWTIGIELLGSWLVFALLALFGNMRNRTWVYTFIALVFLIQSVNSKSYTYYLMFLIGLLYSEMVYSNTFHLKLKYFLTSLYFPLLLLLLTYSWSVLLLMNGKAKSVEMDYTTINFLITVPLRAIAWFFMVANSTTLKFVLGSKIFRYFGKISFSLYLIHTLLIYSFGTYLYLYFFAEGMILKEHMMIIILVLTIVLSSVYEFLFDRPGKTIFSKFLQKFIGASIDNQPISLKK